jgi:hypothetical protein
VSATVDRLRERLANPDAVLSRTDLRDLGFGRRAVDAVFREAARREGVVLLPGYRRPMIRVAVYDGILAEATYGDGDGRVWPS